jgi:hypothetical protein
MPPGLEQRTVTGRREELRRALCRDLGFLRGIVVSQIRVAQDDHVNENEERPQPEAYHHEQHQQRCQTKLH